MFGIKAIKTPYSALFAAAMLVFASVGEANTSASPFAQMAGTWSGAGAITLRNGTVEQIRCRAVYNVDPTGAKLDLHLRCANGSYKFEFKSKVANNNGHISGTWTEVTHDVSGTVSGRAT